MNNKLFFVIIYKSIDLFLMSKNFLKYKNWRNFATFDQNHVH